MWELTSSSAICILFSIRSKSQPDPAGPKYVAVKTLCIRKGVFDGYCLFHSSYLNTKISIIDKINLHIFFTHLASLHPNDSATCRPCSDIPDLLLSLCTWNIIRWSLVKTSLSHDYLILFIVCIYIYIYIYIYIRSTHWIHHTESKLLAQGG